MLGVIWETFEFLAGVTSFPVESLDTILDLAMDTMGGFAGIFLAKSIEEK